MPPTTRVNDVSVRGSVNVSGDMTVDGYIEIGGVRLTANDLRRLLSLVSPNA